MLQTENTKEIASLTGFRALAAAMVWFCHYFPSGPKADPYPLLWTFQYGASGVYFFFALSGFLFTVLYFDKQFDKKALSAYFIKRITRIYPTYWVVMGTVVLLGIASVESIIPFPPFSIVDFLLNAFLLQGYITRDMMVRSAWHLAQPAFTVHAYLGHAWTLTVEELFYACFPLILFFIRSYCVDKTKSRISILKVIAFLTAIALLEVGLWGQFSCFALGIISGLLVLQYPQSKWINDRWLNSLLGMAGLVTFGLAVFLIGKENAITWFEFYKPNMAVYAFAFGVSGTFLILALYGNSWLRNVFENKTVVYCGKISFAFYLIHVPMIAFLKVRLFSVLASITGKDAHWPPAMLFLAVFMFFITGLLSAFIYEKIEMPVQTYLRTLWLQGKHYQTKPSI